MDASLDSAGFSGPGTALRNVSQLASWSVSSSKPGFGVDKLVDPSINTLWQSEGPQPHLISIQFPRRMPIAQLSMFVDVKIDDSYTPNRLSIRAGTYYGDLQEVRLIDLEDPRGWQHFTLGNSTADDPDADPSDPESPQDLTPNEISYPFTSRAIKMHETIR